MGTVNESFLFKGRSISKALVILFAALLCSVLILATADDSDATTNDKFVFEGINYVITSEVSFDTFDGTVKVGENPTFLGNLTIPDQVTNGDPLKTYSVTSIGDSSFSYCYYLTSITIGNNVTSIGNNSFSGCSSLTSVIIPDSVTSIGDYAFSDCSGLTALTIPIDIVTTNGMFRNCSNLTSLTLTKGQTGIGANYSDYNDYYYPNKYQYTPWYQSRSNSLSVTIEDGVTSIGSYAFCECSKLISIDIPSSVTSIGNNAFKFCSGLKSIIIPDSVTSIGNSAFNGCYRLTSITIPDSVTYIGNSAFYGCSGLKSITIPDSVTSIGDSAFYGCVFKSSEGYEILNLDAYTLKGHTYSGSDWKHLVQDVPYTATTDSNNTLLYIVIVVLIVVIISLIAVVILRSKKMM